MLIYLRYTCHCATSIAYAFTCSLATRLAKPYAACVEAESISRSRGCRPQTARTCRLTPTDCYDFSWSPHAFRFFQLYFWSIVELAPLKLSGTGDNPQLRVERVTLRTTVLVGHTSSSAGRRRGVYVRRGTVHSLHCGRMSLPAFIASEGWKANLAPRPSIMRLQALLLHHPRIGPQLNRQPQKPLLTLLPNISLHPDYAIHEHAILRLPTTATTQQRRRAPDTTPSEHPKAWLGQRNRMGIWIAQ
jgi:hypothetical protein